MSDRATSALVVVLACVAGVALMIGIVSLLTATLDSGRGGTEISIPYAAAWTAVALAVLGSAIAIPFYPHIRLQLVAVTAAWAMALVALVAAGGMRDDSTAASGDGDRDCTRLALETSSNVELAEEDCAPRAEKSARR